MPNVKAPRLTQADMTCVEMAIVYIDKYYRCKISAEHLSVEVNLPKEKLQAGFQKRTKMTLHQYLLQIRIQKAKDLLANTNSPLKSIAYLTGFKDESYFCKVFKKFADITPIEFRFRQVV